MTSYHLQPLSPCNAAEAVTLPGTGIIAKQMLTCLTESTTKEILTAGRRASMRCIAAAATLTATARCAL